LKNELDHRIRLLLVEDDPDDAEIICLELERHGFELDTLRVDTEPEFVGALDSREWDFIISDFQMPTFDGLRAFAVYVQRDLDIPFVFVSGALGEERAVEAMRAGARDYLLKGNLTRLNVVVSRELRAAKSRKERRIAEEAAETERRRLTMAVAASGVGVFEFRLPTTPDLYVSPRLAEILGYSPEQLPAHDRILDWVRTRVHPDDLAALKPPWRRFVSGETERCNGELRMRNKKNQWVEISAWAQAARRDARGVATHVVTVVLDLTERKRLEGQLRQSQKMEAVGLLAGGVAHDFNNLLTAIFSFGQFVLDEIGENGPAHADMLEVLRAARRAEGLTSQLLAFSRRRAVSPQILDINDVVQQIDRMLQRVLGEHISVSTAFASPSLVHIDPGALEQVLMNLAVNARDAMPSGGTLKIETSTVTLPSPAFPGLDLAPGPHVLLALSDTGTGMDEETQSRIFEPFFTTKETGRGTGLGLSTCYGIVTQARGQIRVVSELGRGSTFQVLLPMSNAPQAVEADRHSTPVSVRGSETILLAEDDEQVRRLTVRLLRNLGYVVHEASDGVRALERLAEIEGPIDLLITDLVMPELGGKELARMASERRPGLKVLAMTGYSDVLPGDADVAHLIQKPFTPADLARKLRQILDLSDGST
jgi:two-component system cell cycle sensor histidine kinase/response regulator CckA